MLLQPERGNQKSWLIAANVRLGLVQTAARMIASRPAFGIGLAEFSRRSGEFSSPELLAAFPPAVHENAHNNFLQVTAELGLAGGAAFVWLLAAALRGSVRAASAGAPLADAGVRRARRLHPHLAWRSSPARRRGRRAVLDPPRRRRRRRRAARRLEPPARHGDGHRPGRHRHAAAVPHDRGDEGRRPRARRHRRVGLGSARRAASATGRRSTGPRCSSRRPPASS